MTSTPPTTATHSANTRSRSRRIDTSRWMIVWTDQRVERGDRGGLDRRREAAEERRRARSTGIASSHFAAQSAAPRLAATRTRCRPASGDDALAHAPRRDHRRQQHARQDAADEQVLDRNLRDDAVEDERQRGRQQQAERAGGGQQAEREALAIAVLAAAPETAARRARGS